LPEECAVTDNHHSNEYTVFRTYTAPLELVWQAWVDPELSDKWWGPRGISTKTQRKVARTGGDWLFTMTTGDGTQFNDYIKFTEVVPQNRLAYEHGSAENQTPSFRVVVSFSECDGKTSMIFKMIFPSANEAEQTRSFVRSVGGESTWDRLAEFLEAQKSGKDVFVINRSFEVEREGMYQIWTEPEHLKIWTAPAGFTNRYLTENIHEGGESFYEMSGNGLTMYGKVKYIEMTNPARIVYTQAFADRNGGITRHPLASSWPLFIQTTVCFFEEGPSQTRIALQWEVFGKATEQECATFNAAKEGMAKGWTGSFDKLESYINSDFLKI
jgi:uncharacterized protein YndB with AHSA1/START domain